MKAVIVAGGLGKRMRPLKTPKPLLPVAGKPLLHHTLHQLNGLVDEVVVVVGHQKEELVQFLQNTSVNYTIAEQASPKGTFDALLQARPYLDDRFLVLNGDDLYSREDMQTMLTKKRAVLAKEVLNPERFGVIEHDSFLKRILEKPTSPPSSLANTGMFVLDSDVFTAEVPLSSRGEKELTDAVSLLKNVEVVTAKEWHPIGYPWDLLRANEHVLQSLEAKNEGTVENHVTIKGPVVIGKGTVIKSGAYIEGPVVIGKNCEIGPNCYIRGSTTIGNHCKVKNAVEIKNSILGDHVSAGHLTYLGDSILGNNINLGGGTIASNLRHDNQNVHVLVEGKLVDTGRRKMGCVIGDGVHTGIHTSLYPGRILDRNTEPGEIIK